MAKKAAKKKPGRKPATDEERASWRNVLYRVRLTAGEAEQIAKGAKSAGVSISTYLRDCALAASLG